MNKKTKWGIIILVGAGIIGGGIYSQLPKKNDELAAADKVMSGNQKRGKQVLNVNAKVIKPQSLTDEFTTTGVLLPLTKIAPLKVEFSVPERYAKQIKKGTNLNFSVEGTLDAFGAQVYAVESAIDPNLHQFTARALYPNVHHTLLPGRYASVLLKKEEIPNAIAIPTEAIVPEMGKDKVYLYKSGKAEPVDIITGIRTASEVQAIRGLHIGDTIITSGTLQLRTGLAVTLDNID